MMNCPNCNEPLADGRKFCANCGCPADAPDFFDANALGIGFADVLTKKYACFQGRARRKEYWMFILFTWIIGFVLQGLVPFIFAPTFGKFIYFVYLCGFGIPVWALTVRRFHDTGKNGLSGALLWGAVWGLGMFSFFLTPMNGITVTKLVDIYGGTLAEMICGFLQLGLQVVVFFLASFDSQPGPNKYGPNPKGQ